MGLGTLSNGFIIRFTPPASGAGQWTPTLVHQFDGTDALSPQFTAFGYDGTLFGADGSEVFRLTPPRPGESSWAFSVLYNDKSGIGNGALLGNFVQGGGALFGTGSGSGVLPSNVIWKLTPPPTAQAAWSFSILDTIAANSPNGNLPGIPIIDRSQRIYDWNKTSQKGFDIGTVFRVSPPGPGDAKWHHDLLYAFQGAADGGRPTSLIEAPDGRLYGVNHCFGSYDVISACQDNPDENLYPVDTLFRLTPRDYGGHLLPWNHLTVHTFNASSAGPYPDGLDPEVFIRDILPDGTFALFGMTTLAGGHNIGTVFEYVP